MRGRKSHIETSNPIVAQSRLLRLKGEHARAYQLASTAIAGSPQAASILWPHQPLFWQVLRAGCCMLTRRGPADIEFIRALWNNPGFMHKFHRLAAPLPEDTGRLSLILENEYCSLLHQSGSIHWVIRDHTGHPWGVLSITEVSLRHKRAEILIGILPAAPFGLAVTAMFLLFDFYFNTLKFNKLYSLTYDDNSPSYKGAQHLGFIEEGRHREHVYDPASGKYLDLVQSGLLAFEANSLRNQRLKSRLFRSRS